MESVRRFRCVALADRLEELVVAIGRDEDPEELDGAMYRFEALTATASEGLIDPK